MICGSPRLLIAAEGFVIQTVKDSIVYYHQDMV